MKSRSTPLALWERSLQILIDSLFDTRIHLHRCLVVEGKGLHHHDDTDLVPRIDEEVRIEDAGPRAATGGASVRLLFGGQLKAESPFVLAGAKGEVLRER